MCSLESTRMNGDQWSEGAGADLIRPGQTWSNLVKPDAHHLISYHQSVISLISSQDQHYQLTCSTSRALPGFARPCLQSGVGLEILKEAIVVLVHQDHCPLDLHSKSPMMWFGSPTAIANHYCQWGHQVQIIKWNRPRNGCTQPACYRITVYHRESATLQFFGTIPPQLCLGPVDRRGSASPFHPTGYAHRSCVNVRFLYALDLAGCSATWPPNQGDPNLRPIGYKNRMFEGAIDNSFSACVTP